MSAAAVIVIDQQPVYVAVEQPQTGAVVVANGTNVAVVDAGAQVAVTLVEPQTSPVVLGGVGPIGPPGPAGLGTTTGIAAVPLSGHRVVTTDTNGQLVYASSDTPAHRHGPLWVTTAAALAGDSIECVSLGEVVEPSWTWTPEAGLYLGLNGVLTETAPSSGFAVQIAVAITATTIFVDPTVSILLA